MKYLKLERHNYAPELNKLHLKNGVVLPIPNMSDIRQVREKLFRPVRQGKYSIISVTNKKYSFLNEEYKGYIDNYSHLKTVINVLKKKHNVEGTIFKVKSSIIG